MLVTLENWLKFTKYLRSHLTFFNFKVSNILALLFILLSVSYILGIYGGLFWLISIFVLLVLSLHIGISIVHIIKDYLYLKELNIYARYIFVYILVNLVVYFIV